MKKAWENCIPAETILKTVPKVYMLAEAGEEVDGHKDEEQEPEAIEDPREF